MSKILKPKILIILDVHQNILALVEVRFFGTLLA